MKITPTTFDKAVPIFVFIKMYYVPARTWRHDAALHWLRWNMRQGFLAYTLEGEKIVGVGIMRPVMRPEDGPKTCQFDPEGPCLFADLAVAVNPIVLGVLLNQMRHRFGMRGTIAFVRGPHRGLSETLHVRPLKPWFARMIRPLLTAFPSAS